jgi:hypothetical protein
MFSDKYTRFKSWSLYSCIAELKKKKIYVYRAYESFTKKSKQHIVTTIQLWTLDTLETQLSSRSELYYDRRSVGQSVLVSSPHLGLMTRYLLLLDSCGFVDMRRPLWWEDGSVDYNCCCLRQRSHSQERVPWGSWPHFTVSNLRLPKPGGPGPCIYIPQEQGDPVIPPGTG